MIVSMKVFSTVNGKLWWHTHDDDDDDDDGCKDDGDLP